ncbi:MAG: hypothetical protein ACI8TQ_002789 [Planctomycetota bacterium]|jgi:hypothetical protein
MKIQTQRAIGFSVAHFLVLIVSAATAFSFGMERFDAGDARETAVEFVASALTKILMMPGRLIWTPWASKNVHDSLEWVLLLANSALWGIALAYVYGKIRKAK